MEFHSRLLNMSSIPEDTWNKELKVYVHVYALTCIFALVVLVLFCLTALRKLGQHIIDANLCSQLLNFVTPVKTCLHVHLPFVLLLFGHPFVYLFHLPIMIWSWSSLPSLSYDQRNLEQPAIANNYHRNLVVQLLFFCVLSFFHGTVLTEIIFYKVIEWVEIWEEQFKLASESGNIYVEGEELLGPRIALHL